MNHTPLPNLPPLDFVAPRQITHAELHPNLVVSAERTGPRKRIVIEKTDEERQADADAQHRYETHASAVPKGTIDRTPRRVRDIAPAALERQVQALLAANGALRDELAEAQNIAAGAA